MISVTYMYMSLLLECVPFVMAPEVSSSHSVSLLAVFLTFLGLSSSFLLVPITTNTHTQRKGGGHTHTMRLKQLIIKEGEIMVSYHTSCGLL